MRPSPASTLRTTLIAGFPGETEEQYAELCDFVKTVKFDRLGCFAYSAEENTVAAKMPNQLDEETKQRRADHIMELQAEVSAAREGEKVGNTYECICDGVDDETGMYLLRTKADCPEIDGNVLTPADYPAWRPARSTMSPSPMPTPTICTAMRKKSWRIDV